MDSTFEAKPYTGKTASKQWAEYEGVPMIRDFIVPDLNSVAVKPWNRLGASGIWLVLGAPEDQLSMAAYICEIPPGKSIEPQRHVFEDPAGSHSRKFKARKPKRYEGEKRRYQQSR